MYYHLDFYLVRFIPIFREGLMKNFRWYYADRKLLAINNF